VPKLRPYFSHYLNNASAPGVDG